MIEIKTEGLLGLDLLQKAYPAILSRHSQFSKIASEESLIAAVNSEMEACLSKIQKHLEEKVKQIEVYALGPLEYPGPFHFQFKDSSETLRINLSLAILRRIWEKWTFKLDTVVPEMDFILDQVLILAAYHPSYHFWELPDSISSERYLAQLRKAWMDGLSVFPAFLKGYSTVVFSEMAFAIFWQVEQAFLVQQKLSGHFGNENEAQTPSSSELAFAASWMIWEAYVLRNHDSDGERSPFRTYESILHYHESNPMDWADELAQITFEDFLWALVLKKTKENSIGLDLGVFRIYKAVLDQRSDLTDLFNAFPQQKLKNQAQKWKARILEKSQVEILDKELISFLTNYKLQKE